MRVKGVKYAVTEDLTLGGEHTRQYTYDVLNLIKINKNHIEIKNIYMYIPIGHI